MEALGLEEVGEPAAGLYLLVAQLGMSVDLPRERLELAGESVGGALDVGLDGAHENLLIGWRVAAALSRSPSGA
jgi:hypothetical protein